jgi:hypothetical protein
MFIVYSLAYTNFILLTKQTIHMKKTHAVWPLLVWASASFLFSCKDDDVLPVTNPGTSTDTVRDVGNFSKLVIKAPVVVYLKQGAYEKLKILADSAIVKLIETKVVNDSLVIKVKNDATLTTSNPIKIFITVPKVLYANLAGAGGLLGQNKFNYLADTVVYVLSGAGTFKAELDAIKLKAKISGAGGIELTNGTANDLELETAGAGMFNDETFITKNAAIKLAGAGNVRVHAQQKLDVNISGTGSVFYKGNPVITQNITGTGVLVKIP